jgi:ATP-dependent Lhr-like helicase
MYRVLAGAQDIGSIEPTFVERLVEGMSAFLLAGRPWVVDRVVHADREVHVHPAPAGRKPTWGGFLPQMLGKEICQRIRLILESNDALDYLHPSALVALDGLRVELGPLLRRVGPAVQIDADGQALWWTFAGARINYTLKYALEVAEGWKVVAENFHMKISGDGLNHSSLLAALHALGDSAFWEDPDRVRAIRARLPPFRMSKFQDALPDAAVTEMLAKFFIDAAGAQAVIEASRLTKT